ncbi:hypothetical protein SteCoe_33967 [Stentor coeruleus]|uniref:Uncharacterized protein n=1 Tax=Stentor coeruleus TaxID=5963 RepID=A0A1R2AVM0_9CILI|nr:hypothetical protein SteCoe_33967 [Stentor coeruleus]
MEVSQEVYIWLNASDIVKKINPSPLGIYHLNEEDSENLEFGLTFGPILRRTIKLLQDVDKKSVPKSKLDLLKQSKTAASKKFNWKIISGILDDLKIFTLAEEIELIKTGSMENLEHLLESILRYEQELLTKLETSSQSVSSINSEAPIKVFPKSKKKNGELIIESISGDIPLETTESCLEFLLVTFCKLFALRPKQAAGLLTQSGKYLAYTLSHGLKGKHDAIVAWYQSVYANSYKLLQLMSKESQEGGVSLVLTSVHFGLYSKSIETVLWCSRVLTKLGTELQSKNFPSNLNFNPWIWFANYGFKACLSACRKFGSYVKGSVASVIIIFAKGYFSDLLRNVMQEIVPEIIQYIATVHEFFPLFCEIKSVKDELISSGTIEYFLSLSIQEAENIKLQADERMTSIHFLCDIWILVPTVVENLETISNQAISILERVSRDKSSILKIGCLGKMFQMLAQFAQVHNVYAPVIYKILTFSLIENYGEEMIKEFIIYNFIHLIEEIPEIPIKIVVEPLVKHLKISGELNLNISDLTFLSIISQHEKLNLKIALQLMDSLAKLYTVHLHVCDLLGDIFLTLCERFIALEPVHKYLRILIEVFLKNLSKDAKHLKDNNLNLAIMELIAGCIRINCEKLNQSIKFVFCDILVDNSSQAFSEWIMSILSLIGDPMEIIEDYKHKLIELVPSPAENIKSKISGKFKPNAGEDLNHTKESHSPKIEKPKQNNSYKENYESGKAKNQKKSLRKQIEKKIIVEKKEEQQKHLHEFKLLVEILPDDMELIKVAEKSHHKLLERVFKKYSIAHQKAVKTNTFADMTETVTHISDTEIHKLLKDLSLGHLSISQSTFVEFSREFNIYKNKQKSTLDFNEFQDFLVHLSLVIYSEPPHDYSLYPAVIPFMHLLKTLEFIENDYKLLIAPTISPQKVPNINYFNEQLTKNPDFELPKGYKKHHIKDVKICFSVPSNLGVSESFSNCIEIFDDILHSCLGVHFLEPVPIIVQIFKAFPDHTPSVPKSRNTSEDFSIESLHKPKIVNKVIEVKKIAKEVQERVEIEKEKKRLLRVQVVKSTIQKTLQDKLIKDLEAKKKAEDDEAKKKNLIKRLEAKFEKDRKMRLEEIEKWKKAKEEEQKIKEIKEKERIDKEREARLKKRDEFIEVEKQRIRNLSQEIIEKRKSVAKIEVVSKSRLEKKKLKKLEEHKKELDKVRKMKEDQESKEKEFQNEYNDQAIQNIIKIYEKSFELVYAHYCNAKYLPNSDESLRDSIMSFTDFYKFATIFKIVPDLLSQQDARKLFISVMKNHVGSSINFDSFKMLCYKISKLYPKSESVSTVAESLTNFLAHLELPKDINAARDMLRRKETKKYLINN